MDAIVGYKSITIPIIGTKIGIKSVSNKGYAKDLVIIGGEESDVFVALFDEQDVDFQIIADNRENERGIRLRIAINNEKHSFIIRANHIMNIRALETNGRKMHFLSQNTNEGKVLVAKNAVLNDISYEESAVSVSRIEFEVEVEVIKDKIRRLSKCEQIIIFVKYGSERYEFKIDKNKQIMDLKRDIEERLKIRFFDKMLELNGKQWKSSDYLQNCGIKDGNELILHKHIVESPSFQIDIKITSGKTRKYFVTNDTTIMELMLQIEESDGISVDQIRLILDGKPLNSDRSLNHYNIERGSTLHMVYGTEGGYATTRLTARQSSDDSSDESQSTYGESSDEDNQYGERGVVCFGERSDQKFKTYRGFVSDYHFDIEPFVLEMRMDSKYSLNCN